MSKKLSYDAYIDSLDALIRFRNNNAGTDLRKNIIISTNNNEIKSFENVEVIVAERYPNYQIDIYWEEVMDDFKDLDLRGTYDPQFASMAYDEIELVLIDQGNKIIIK